jgi:hypothetical protein
MRKTLLAALFVGVVAVAPGAANAAKGDSVITLDRHNPYAIGEVVTFSSSTTLSDRPWETARCFKEGEQVYYESHPAYWPNRGDDPGEFTLGPTDLWSSGGASCVAELRVIGKNGALRTVASVDFVVAG